MVKNIIWENGGKMEQKVEVKINIFVEKIKEIAGENLKSCIVYGSVAKENYKEGISDINIIVILEKIDYEEIERIRKNLSKLAYKHMIKPFFFSEWFLSSSSDVFPVEWKDIKENHIVVYGKDITEEISIKKENLRIYLERECKQNYINFQQALLFEKDIIFALSSSVKNLSLILKDIDMLTEEKINEPGYFEKIKKLEKGKEKIKKKELNEIIKKHFDFLSKVIKLIDKGDVK